MNIDEIEEMLQVMEEIKYILEHVPEDVLDGVDMYIGSRVKLEFDFCKTTPVPEVVTHFTRSSFADTCTYSNVFEHKRIHDLYVALGGEDCTEAEEEMYMIISKVVKDGEQNGNLLYEEHKRNLAKAIVQEVCK